MNEMTSTSRADKTVNKTVNVISSLSYKEYILVNCILDMNSELHNACHDLELIALTKQGLFNCINDIFDNLESIDNLDRKSNNNISNNVNSNVNNNVITINSSTSENPIPSTSVTMFMNSIYIKLEGIKTVINFYNIDNEYTNLTDSTKEIMNNLMFDFKRCCYNGNKIYSAPEVLACLRTNIIKFSSNEKGSLFRKQLKSFLDCEGVGFSLLLCKTYNLYIMPYNSDHDDLFKEPIEKDDCEKMYAGSVYVRDFTNLTKLSTFDKFKEYFPNIYELRKSAQSYSKIIMDKELDKHFKVKDSVIVKLKDVPNWTTTTYRKNLISFVSIVMFDDKIVQLRK
jgi:hypothetical protein